MKLWRLGKWLAIIGGVLAVASVIAWKTFLPGLIEMQLVDKDGRADYLTWKTKKIHLPASALTAEPYRAETQQAAEELDRVFHERSAELSSQIDDLWTSRSDLSRVKRNYDTLDYVKVEVVIARWEAPLNAFQHLAEQPDYVISAALADGRNFPFTDLWATQEFARLLKLKGYDLMHRGDFAGADGCCELIVRISRIDDYEQIINSLIHAQCCTMAVETWVELVRHCTDRRVLHTVLDELNALAAHPMALHADIQLGSLLSIGQIRELMRRGVTCDIQDLTGMQLAARQFALGEDYRVKSSQPAVKNDPVAKAAIQKAADSMLQSSSLFDPEWVSKHYPEIAPVAGRFGIFGGPSTRMLTVAKLFPYFWFNAEELRVRAGCLTDAIELVRIMTAKRLYGLEEGHEVEDARQLVPKYLPTLPHDAFAPGEQLRQHDGTFYSVGPDGKDDGALQLNDPTNGTVSGGDIFIGR